MTDIFISYSRADKARVKPLVDALLQKGWSVWWDPTILPGKMWDQVIERALADSRCVIVLWSAASVQSHWVQTEAHEGMRRAILVPALLDPVDIPLAFRRIQAANLAGFAGAPNPAFNELAEAVSEVLATSPPVAQEQPKQETRAAGAETQPPPYIKPDPPTPPEPEAKTAPPLWSKASSPWKRVAAIGLLAAAVISIILFTQKRQPPAERPSSIAKSETPPSSFSVAQQNPPTSATVSSPPKVDMSTTVNAAIKYFDAGQYAEAFPLFQKSTDAGDATATGYLALMYDFGDGLPTDQIKAASLYRKAADGGFAFAMASLGHDYANGLGGLPKDDVEAVRWYRKAADAGERSGMRHLGYMYEFGRGGLPKDEAQALSWYRKAAAAGDDYAMYNLGRMYESGKGVSKDQPTSISWYRKAATAKNEDAQNALKRLGQ